MTGWRGLVLTNPVVKVQGCWEKYPVSPPSKILPCVHIVAPSFAQAFELDSPVNIWCSLADLLSGICCGSEEFG